MSNVAELDALEHGACAIANAEFGEHTGYVIFDRAVRKIERKSDLAVTETGREKLEDLDLALGQRRGERQYRFRTRQFAGALKYALGERGLEVGASGGDC